MSYPADNRRTFQVEGPAKAKNPKQSTLAVYEEEQGGWHTKNMLRVEDEVRR